MGMIRQAEADGLIKPGDTLIEATSGNTGIALAMSAAIRGYRLMLVMPETASQERRAVMRAYGAEIRLTDGMESARDEADALAREGKGKILNQFANLANPQAHFETTGPEIWQDTDGTVTHFVSAMGTTGTIMGVSRYLKQRREAIEIIGVQPAENASIPGIRRWPTAYLPEIFDPQRVDRTIDVSQSEAESMTRRLASEEGIFAGVSSGGCVTAALALSRQLENAVIVCIICDRGDRYLSTGLFPAD